MRMAEIRIRRYGVWHDLSLPLPDSGLCVVYGPNEAGKTTLMRFVREVLYGFEPRESESPLATEPPDGTLIVMHDGQRCELQRTSQGTGHGVLSVRGLSRLAPADELLSELLCGTGESLFRNVFAVGLKELQELATLRDADVARHIYGLSLGPEGTSLLAAARSAEIEAARYYDAETGTGELVDLLERDSRLSDEIRAFDPLRGHHADLGQEKLRLEGDISELKARHRGMQSQLQGHRFLDRVYAPWNQVREYREELRSLPVINDFPENGRERLDEIETQLQSAIDHRDAALQEKAHLDSQTEAIPVSVELEREMATVGGLVDQYSWLAELQAGMTELRQRGVLMRDRLTEMLDQLGEDWTIERLESIDAAPVARFEMLEAARTYQRQLSRRIWSRKRYRRLVSSCRQRLTRLNEQKPQFRGESINDAVEQVQQQLVDLDELRRLTVQKEELDRHITFTAAQIEQLKPRSVMPTWVIGMLGILAAAGTASSILGFSTGLIANGISGTMLALAGVTGLAVAWGGKRQFDSHTRNRLDELRTLLAERQASLNSLDQDIARLGQDTASDVVDDADSADGTVAVEEDANVPDKDVSVTELMEAAVSRLSALRQFAAEEERIRERRRHLSELRNRFRSIQHEVAIARQAWCESLRRLGLPETVRIDEAFEVWQQVFAAMDICRRWRMVTEQWEIQQAVWDSICRQIDETAARLNGGDPANIEPLQRLAGWRDELRLFQERREARRQLIEAAQQCQRDADDRQRTVDELERKRSALLVQGGAADREEFGQRFAWVQRRAECLELLEIAEEELDAVAQTEPDLAVVENDLLDYNADDNRIRIETLEIELAELDDDLHRLYEQLGQVGQQIASLEADRQQTTVRFERELVAERLRQTTERWIAVRLAGRSVEAMKTEFERTRQPQVLVATARHLRWLTRGRYTKVWCRLGEQTLRIDDDRGRTFRVEQLSGGTREQLFLAIRLAMVEQMSEEGVELPMILDDVTVNFDDDRVRAAAETLMQFTSQGRQVLLFTCHQHLAGLFESSGVSLIRLPSREISAEERRAG